MSELNKELGFDIIVQPLLQILEDPNNSEKIIFLNEKKYTYSLMATMIRLGQLPGVQYAVRYIQKEREEFNELKTKIQP